MPIPIELERYKRVTSQDYWLLPGGHKYRGVSRSVGWTKQDATRYARLFQGLKKELIDRRHFYHQYIGRRSSNRVARNLAQAATEILRSPELFTKAPTVKDLETELSDLNALTTENNKFSLEAVRFWTRKIQALKSVHPMYEEYELAIVRSGHMRNIEFNQKVDANSFLEFRRLIRGLLRDIPKDSNYRSGKRKQLALYYLVRRAFAHCDVRSPTAKKNDKTAMTAFNLLMLSFRDLLIQETKKAGSNHKSILDSLQKPSEQSFRNQISRVVDDYYKNYRRNTEWGGNKNRKEYIRKKLPYFIDPSVDYFIGIDSGPAKYRRFLYHSFSRFQSWLDDAYLSTNKLYYYPLKWLEPIYVGFDRSFYMFASRSYSKRYGRPLRRPRFYNDCNW